MEFSHAVVDVIQSRKSIRNYQTKSLSQKDHTYMQNLIQHLPGTPYGNDSIFTLMMSQTGDNLMRLPQTYGVVRGATAFLVGTAKDEFRSLLDFGYQMEWIILHAWDRGIASCWLGGTFQRGKAVRYLDLEEDHIIPAVSPVGYAKGHEGMMDGLIHTIMGSKKRKHWKDMFFHKSWDSPMGKYQNEAIGKALEMVRLGPSAINRQPWRLVVDEPWIHFFIGTGGITHYIYKGMFPLIDIGVACCHFELTMNGYGHQGQWFDSPRGKDLTQPGVQYCVSWRRDE